MAMQYIVETEEQVTQSVPKNMELANLGVEQGDINQPSRWIVILRNKDQNGAWNEAVKPIKAELADTPDLPIASKLIKLFLLSVIPDNEDSQELGIANLTWDEAGTVILATLGISPVTP